MIIIVARIFASVAGKIMLHSESWLKIIVFYKFSGIFCLGFVTTVADDNFFIIRYFFSQNVMI